MYCLSSRVVIGVFYVKFLFALRKFLCILISSKRLDASHLKSKHIFSEAHRDGGQWMLNVHVILRMRAFTHTHTKKPDRILSSGRNQINCQKSVVARVFLGGTNDGCERLKSKTLHRTGKSFHEKLNMNPGIFCSFSLTFPKSLSSSLSLVPHSLTFCSRLPSIRRSFDIIVFILISNKQKILLK